MPSTETHGELTFENWGTPVAQQAKSPGLARRLAVIAIAVTIVAALIVHVTGGGSANPASPAQAVANAINLRPSDVPGFHIANNSGVTESGNPAGEFQRCFGTLTVSAGSGAGVVTDAAVSDLGSFSSPDFVEREGLSTVSLGSQVSFVSDSALASDAAAARNPRFAECFAQALAAITYDAHGVQVTGSDPTAETLPVPIVPERGVDPLLGLRANIVWSANGTQIPVTADIYLVGVGHKELSLFDLSTEHPYSTSAEGHLLALLVRRAR
jgi:hypothetical protein